MLSANIGEEKYKVQWQKKFYNLHVTYFLLSEVHSLCYTYRHTCMRTHAHRPLFEPEEYHGIVSKWIRRIRGSGKEKTTKKKTTKIHIQANKQACTNTARPEKSLTHR